ncbi:MAG: phosphoribosylaminoimidazolesuccinocarboxamide synthase [Gammaproteobacteria bacterium]|jgi:phosphoribosylaminoimidazole-succinocarboxamide synthase
MTPASEPVFNSNLSSLPLLGRGKVRDIYALGEDRLLILASDRMSAFDVVLPDPIPNKGPVLTAISTMWFEHLEHIISNHLTGIDPASVVSEQDAAIVAGRSVVCERLNPLPIEAVVRGYLIGSGWKDYCAGGRVSGVELPSGLGLAERLPEPIFTPSTKAQQGSHDENITFQAAAELIGHDLAQQVQAISLRMYAEASRLARKVGIIIADTKFEFGLTDTGELRLIDEVLTPDSSRFWPAETYKPGVSPPSFDKQYVRDYLETLGWDKRPPAPHLPAVVIARTSEKYLEALKAFEVLR